MSSHIHHVMSISSGLSAGKKGQPLGITASSSSSGVYGTFQEPLILDSHSSGKEATGREGNNVEQQSTRYFPLSAMSRMRNELTSSDRVRWDKTVKHHTVGAFANACFGVGLMLVLNECSLNKSLSGFIKATMSVSTAALLYQLFLIQWYRFRIKLALLARRQRPRALKHTIKKDLLPYVPQSTFLRQILYPFDWDFWFFSMICAVHLPPGTEGYIPQEIGLLMFLRVNLLLDVLKVYSSVYQRRHLTRARLPTMRVIYSRGTILRGLLYQNPLTFGLTSTVLCLLIIAYSLHVLERPTPDSPFNMWISLWVSANCVLVLWPTDIYDTYDPATWGGRVTALLGSMIGLILTAFVIGATCDQIVCSQQEKKLVMYNEYATCLQEQRDAAARLLQYVIKSYCYEKQLERKFEEDQPELYEAMYEAHDKIWYKKVAVFSQRLRRLRLARTEMEQLHPDWKRAAVPAIPYSSLRHPLIQPSPNQIAAKTTEVLESGEGTPDPATDKKEDAKEQQQLLPLLSTRRKLSTEQLLSPLHIANTPSHALQPPFFTLDNLPPAVVLSEERLTEVEGRLAHLERMEGRLTGRLYGIESTLQDLTISLAALTAACTTPDIGRGEHSRPRSRHALSPSSTFS